LRSQRELIAQLREQTLADGGHYERSPQYHCILLEDNLDLYSLLRANKTLFDAQTRIALERTITAALQFLTGIATPDDDIPLFNDSASGVASRPSAIFAKAKALGFAAELHSAGLINFPASGLFGWKNGSDYFAIDCGDIGPHYQPGHTHCDFLSFVLMIDGQWLVVDSGVAEYEPGPLRQYVRSTAAHNTVLIDDQDQSEVWGEFRVGRRAANLGAAIKHDGNTIVFEGAYKGFPTVSAGIVHRRRVTLALSDNGNIRSVEIVDTVEGNDASAHRIVTLLHLHPAIAAEAGAQTVTLTRAGTTTACVDASVAIDVISNRSWYCHQFGRRHDNLLLQIGGINTLPATLSYKISVANR